jgi:hypothetical protein
MGHQQLDDLQGPVGGEGGAGHVRPGILTAGLTTDGVTAGGTAGATRMPTVTPSSTGLPSTLTTDRPSGLLTEAYKYSFHIANEVA